MVLTLTAITGCASRRSQPGDYSAVQLGELRREADHWALRIQLSNFDFEDPVDVEELSIRVRVNGRLLLDRVEPIALYLPALGIETWQLKAPIDAGFLPSEQMHYEISGRVRTRQYGRSFNYQREGTLSAVPGKPGAWR